MNRKKDLDLQSLLQSQSKETLVDLILELVEESHDLLEQRIRLRLSTGDADEQFQECRELIQSYILRYGDRNGFVSYRMVGKAIQGVYTAQERADESAHNKDWLLAVRIHLYILEELVALVNHADDSDGLIGEAVKRSLRQIVEIAAQVGTGESQQEAVFQLLITQAESAFLDGWSEWRLSLLEGALRLAKTSSRLKEWEATVARLESKLDRESWSDNYFVEQIAVLRYTHIEATGDTARKEAYLKQHLHVPKLRKVAIHEALQEQRYEEAIRLAEEGEVQDTSRRFPGLVHQWRELRYEAYEQLGRIESMRELGRELVCAGDFSYYERLKACYDETEWAPVYEGLMQALGHGYSDVYTEILIYEHDAERLLAYVKNRPYAIERFWAHLMNEFPTEVTSIFQQRILEMAVDATNRQEYKKVCKVIRKLVETGAREAASDTVRELLDKYPRRPAFREELEKLGLS